ncbi:YjzD family protein [Paenilisteria rocourtiae]|uniref:DUF2929 family protein n=1 Tax=Listeria rocourtiae TaxID=647910 RepID=A0A4R6ZQ39_9LIST|nr:YjzD family protein [Listeria rocourtiae]EUJ47957.1 hypothetical protein PROCOU_07278 [Listeria rocourtiae FSL F6-920]MBC1434802.1 YjzD family protein [Listeria rocourtiae]MBC1604692.1 YjzD family protein [Listeria rocourtiae]TDR54512.1 hypothetical protein DFP96_10296 [Listeria rocourtiae]
MRYIITFIWVFILAQMSEYVAASVMAATYDFTMGTIMAVAISIAIFLIPVLMPKESETYDIK